MSKKILDKLASKLGQEDKGTEVSVDSNELEAVLDEHVDAISAARAHDSTHHNNHASYPTY